MVSISGLDRVGIIAKPTPAMAKTGIGTGELRKRLEKPEALTAACS
ncbi:MAG: hypothetical protein ACYSSL_01890 [Planctomycetota bacterium]